jgi:hypothetical protein
MPLQGLEKMEIIEKNTIKENSHLSDKPHWEILLSSKLTDLGVKKEFHPSIIQKTGELMPFCLIMFFGILVAIFGKKDK